MMENILLYKNWERSYSEDTDHEIVFRPSTYNFERRRGGRGAVDLRSDKTFTLRGDWGFGQGNLAADDRYNYAEGSWELADKNILLLQPKAGGVNKLKIIFVSEDKLIIEKQAF